MIGDVNAITMTKVSMVIKFDIIIPTKHGVLFCACLKRTREVASGAIGKGTQMSIAKAYELLGHYNENATQKTVEQLKWRITHGMLNPCENCTVCKGTTEECAQRKQQQKVSQGTK